MTPQIQRLKEWCEFQKADLATHKWKDVFWEECTQRVSDIEFLIEAAEASKEIVKTMLYTDEWDARDLTDYLNKYNG